MRKAIQRGAWATLPSCSTCWDRARRRLGRRGVGRGCMPPPPSRPAEILLYVFSWMIPLGVGSWKLEVGSLQASSFQLPAECLPADAQPRREVPDLRLRQELGGAEVRRAVE